MKATSCLAAILSVPVLVGLTVWLASLADTTQRPRSEKVYGGDPRPEVAGWIDTHTEFGRIRSVRRRPNWAKGARQGIGTSTGRELLFYLKDGRVQTVYEFRGRGPEKVWGEYEPEDGGKIGWPSDVDDDTRDGDHDAYAAWAMAEEYVTAALRSPSTADFGSVGWLGGGELQKPTERAKHLGGGVWIVSGWVDAQNAFGATVREQWIIELKYLGSNRWRRVHLVIGEVKSAADLLWAETVRARLEEG